MFIIYDIQDVSDTFEIETLDEARDFLHNLWDELEETDSFFKEIDTANFEGLQQMLEGCDYSIIQFNHENEVVWLCDNCDEMFEEPTSSCDVCNCSSVRIVHKDDMGL